MVTFRMLLILTAFFMECSSYKTHYVEDYCKSGTATTKYQVHFNQSGSSGILQGKRKESDPLSRNCTFILSPPKGYKLSIAVKKIDFPKETSSRNCESNVKIFYSPLHEPMTLCDHSLLKSNPEILTSEEEIKIVYHTVINGDNNKSGRSDFQLSYTTYTRDIKHCDSENAFLCFNGNCIWNGLVCDGMDNCGDKSDESAPVCDPRMDRVLFQVLYVFTGCALLFVLLAGVITCCCRWRKFRRPMEEDPPNLTPHVTPYQAIHPSGCFICKNPAGPSDPCPLYHPHNLKSEGGFSNPCYPTGIPQHVLSLHLVDHKTDKLPNKISLTL